MKHLVFDRNGKTYSLTGAVITVFNDKGVKLDQWFYTDCELARHAFLKIAEVAA